MNIVYAIPFVYVALILWGVHLATVLVTDRVVHPWTVAYILCGMGGVFMWFVARKEKARVQTVFHIAVILFFTLVIFIIQHSTPFVAYDDGHEKCIMMSDELRGFALRPGSSLSADFPYRCTIDKNGERACGCTRTVNSWLVAGCSYTFGYKVSDDETWPHVLEKMSGQTIRNAGVSGYGTVQSYYTIKKNLVGGSESPRVVMYGFITDHFRRNCGGYEWMKTVKRPIPRAEMTNGELVLLPPSDKWSVRSGNLLICEEEEQSTLKCVELMNKDCDAMGSKFAVVILPDMDFGGCKHLVHHWLSLEMEKRKIPCIDVWDSDCEYKSDHHPSPRGYRMIANAIFQNPVFRQLFAYSASLRAE